MGLARSITPCSVNFSREVRRRAPKSTGGSAAQTLNASTDRDRSIATSQAPWGSNNSSVSGLKRAGRPRWRFSRRCNQKI